MPAFTYVASIIVAEAFGIMFAAAVGSAGVAFVTSAIALGLAITTARLLGLTGGGGGTAQDPGVRIQLPPATNNKVPIVYGTVNTKGTVIDARISNENKTMTYVLALSEQTQTGTFTIGDIYWNDQKLVFRGAGSEHIVASSIDQNGLGESNTNFDGLIRIRVYSSGTNSTQQIFPAQSTGNTSNARTVIGESDTNYQLYGTVYAVVQIDYNSEKGITGLGQITFQVSNSLANPGSVWYDYITSQRYGAGIPVTQVDTSTCIASTTTSLLGWSNTIPSNQFLTGGTTASTQVRYQINGVISAGETVKNNLDKISMGSNAWTTFDYNQGKWKVILNRAATATELNNAFEFNDDNIIGDVGITATNLEDLYNVLEVEFASRKIRDQNDYFRGAIDSSEMNDLEPSNTLSMRLDMVNNALHSARIGLIELKGSRADLIITFRADYSALQCEAGDVVKVTNDVYGFEEKLFRISKMREVEDESGGITVEITALEYKSTVYTDETLEDSADTPGSGIPTFGGSASLPAPSAPTVATISTTTPSFRLETTIDAASTGVDEIQWWYNTTSTGSFSYFANEYPAGGTYVGGVTVTDVVTLPIAGTFYFKARTGLGSRYSELSSSSSPGFYWNPNDYGGI
jgi:hypothetical protein